uniref:DDE Tnp4 domain-containing protein n=1 Tax=Salarias fasciatus TaxID=181472 RepID=A0A672GHH6_SALFA
MIFSHHCYVQQAQLLLLFQHEARIRRENAIRSVWTYQRPGNWWQYVNHSWTDLEWRANFRMGRSTFNKLCDILRPWLTRHNTKYRRAVPVELRVGICIWRLATHLKYRSISHLFGVGLSTCCLIKHEVVTAINKILKPKYIRHPTAAEMRVIVQGFRDKWHFPQVAGAIDGTHINIRAPSENSASYYNRKGDYSITLQAVVDHRMRLWDINVGRAGKIHDARVFALSSLYERETFEGVEVPLALLGDSAYPLLPWLMKPYPEGAGVTTDQISFNFRLSQSRMVVERAFGRLKGRWRCLLKVCDDHITFVSQIVSACCVLHNFLEIHEEDYLDGDTEAEEEVEAAAEGRGGDPQQQSDIRDALCKYFSTL